jgi:hypothetical protein
MIAARYAPHTLIAAAASLALLVPSSARARTSTGSRTPVRMAKEKQDRRACKTDICKAFAAPQNGPAIACGIMGSTSAHSSSLRSLG